MPQSGVLHDPIYGDRDVHGRRIRPAQLDRCNGITSPTPEFPHGIYHYVLLDVPSAKSSIDCFRGYVKGLPDGTFRPLRSGAGLPSFLCHLPTESASPAGRLPGDLRGTAVGFDIGSLPFAPLYRTDREAAAEISNRTVHGVAHFAWVERGGGRFQGQMAVYVKPRGRLGHT